jgi:hypothetical protein
MKARIEKAEELLHLWAYSKFTGRKEIEFSGGYTGDSPISGIDWIAPAFNPVGLNTKITNATETRSRGRSKLPMGGKTSGRARSELYRFVDIIVSSFTPRQQQFLLAAYLPPSCYGMTKRPTDAKLAHIFSIKPSYASRLKGKLIESVCVNLFGPQDIRQAVKT